MGPYKIVKKIAFGGMGVVYKGIHTKLEQEVAIKVLSPQFASNQNMKSKFLSEAKIQAQLSHPNVVNIMNYIEDDDETYLVMEYIDGETLEDLLQRKNKLPIDEAIKISRGILSALKYMHTKGLAHRDIKPSNIMFNKEGVVKVTDFGITKLIGDDKNTKSGLVGSYTYMSPEHILGEEVGVESDLYSFGITLYRMVTGQVPFKGNTEYSIMKGHLEGPRIPPWIINPEINRKIGKVIQKTISRHPRDRYQNVDDLLRDLDSTKDSKFSFDSGDLKFKKLFNNINFSEKIGPVNFRLVLPFLLFFTMLSIGISINSTMDNLVTSRESQDNSSLLNIIYDNNHYNLRGFSLDKFITSLVPDNKNSAVGSKNPHVRTKRNGSERYVKNSEKGKKRFMTIGNYTYTNYNDGNQEEGLKDTLKRTKILPVQ
ncbi:MAG: serine/threonine-protein kinase [Thermodesulfobacteriota bacterium]